LDGEQRAGDFRLVLSFVFRAIMYFQQLSQLRFSFVFGSFWLFFPQPSFVFNNFLASFLKKRILFFLLFRL